MKKFLCMTMLMLVALTVSAMAQTKAASPPEQDIGYQQVGAVTIATPAAEVGMTLVAYRWPGCKPECTNHRCDYTYDVPHSPSAYPFTTAHTDRL